MKRVVVGIGIALVVFLLWRKQPSESRQWSGRAMGCDWKLVTAEVPPDPDEMRSEIVKVLEHWEQVLSTWRPQSDLSRYNRGEPATADLARVIALAEQLQRKTGGAFDHRMLGELHAAGFGPGGSGTDLSSIGKGFAVERVAELLERRGIRRFVFSLAGEVKAGEGEWPVGIESPKPGSGTLAETLLLSNQALATSGNSRLWNREVGGKLASHILNPATRQPVMRPPSSVTVIGPDAAVASGWATALFVLGPEATPRAEAGLRVIWHGTPGD